MEANAPQTLVKVRLVITSDNLPPKIISDFLGVAPTKTWLRGETVHPKATNVHKENGWVLSLEGQSGELITERIIDRLIAMVPHGRLTALYKQHQGAVAVELSIVAHVSGSESVPSISLTQAQVALLADCGGTFDVDVYLR